MLIKSNRKHFVFLLIFTGIFSSLVFISCKDDYIFDEKEPDFLGASIYDYLEEDGHFTYYLRLINDLEYKEVLQKTGSKTVFPANDDAFERFFSSGRYAASYETLTLEQKRLIMNSSMLNMAYLSDMLSNTSGAGGAGEGTALRHTTANSYLDSVLLMKDPVLLENNFWNYYKENDLFLLDNENSAPIVHFTQPFMATKGITSHDFTLIHDRKEYQSGDIYVNGIRVIKKDVICKNGYIHILEEVLTPARNMAQIISANNNISTFNKLLNKFCAPYYSESATQKVHEFYDGSSILHPTLPGADSIYIKRYFNEQTATKDPKGNTLTNYGLLYFDPTDNSYSPGGGMQSDMGAMFVPTNEAMNEYFLGTRGRFLKEAYGTWENVPTDLLAKFLKNHQKKSFINSVPHTWPKLTDEASFKLNISENDLVGAHIGCNGVVYVMNKVFPPIDFQCVYGSTLISSNTKIMNWAIQNKVMKFYLYLMSMENMYNLIIPTDAALGNYRDPVAWAKGVSYREIWSFQYDSSKDIVYADVFDVTVDGGKGEIKKRITDQGIIRNRLHDIVDMHIVVGEKAGDSMSGYIDDGNTNYALTKSGATLKISGHGDNVKMTGGGDIELGVQPAQIVTNEVSGMKSRYDSDNGRTYYVDKILQDPVKSAYTVLSEHPEYKEFFNLLNGDERVFSFFSGDKDITPIFDMKRVGASSGLGLVVNSFNNFRYTVFVPTKEALDNAFRTDRNLFTWDQIAEEEDPVLKKQKAMYLLRFLKYHFMDNSIYISGKSFSNMTYETAAKNNVNKFHRLTLDSNGQNLKIKCDGASAVTANVITTPGLYNTMSRDYIVNAADFYTATNIVASSRAVIHLIDRALRFE